MYLDRAAGKGPGHVSAQDEQDVQGALQLSLQLPGLLAAADRSGCGPLRATPGVFSCAHPRSAKIHTDNSPEFLGLSSANGLWIELGGQGKAGDGVIVGVVDAGSGRSIQASPTMS